MTIEQRIRRELEIALDYGKYFHEDGKRDCLPTRDQVLDNGVEQIVQAIWEALARPVRREDYIGARR